MEIGLGSELERFQRIDRFRLCAGGRAHEFAWSAVDRRDAHGYVAARTELDKLLLDHARAAGAEVREACDAVGAWVVNGVVRGIQVRVDGGQEELRAHVVVAADGASSRIARSLNIAPRNGRVGIAVRNVLDAKLDDDGRIDLHFSLPHGHGLLPGYAWVFPLRGGQANVGVALLRLSPRWNVNMRDLLQAFVSSLPRSWDLAQGQDVVRSPQLRGWRVPMGFAVWPPWRPGLLLAGDAAGVAEPLFGEGISTALRSGLAAGQAALDALSRGDAADLSAYEHVLRDYWGRYYRPARAFVRIAGQPLLARALVETGTRLPGLAPLTYKAVAKVCH